MGIKKALNFISRRSYNLLIECISVRQMSKQKILKKDPLYGYKETEEYLVSSKSVLHLLLILGLTLLMIMIGSSLSPFSGSNLPQCKPIYMYPSYAKIEGFDIRYTKLAKKYHLYLYREQEKDRNPIFNNEIQLDGIPVLFIPGNAGSFKQARSIAAASANLYFDNFDSIENPYTKNLDFFTADFNEDFTAFHGRTMLDQAEYLNDAIRYILSLYEQSQSYKKMQEPPPKSVIVIAHSMGGIIARVMTTLANHVPESINSIITLSSPHSTAPVTFDADILKIYSHVNEIWIHEMSNPDSFYSKNISLISITGGILDTILPADYTSIEEIVPYSNGFTTYSTTIPQVWTPIDHLAIVWCDQLRTIIARFLLEMVDSRTSTKTYSLKKRMELSRKYLLSKLEDYTVQDFDIYKESDADMTIVDLPIYYNVVDANEVFVLDEYSYDTTPPMKIFKIPAEINHLQFSLLSSLDTQSILFCKTNLSKIDIKKGIHRASCISAQNSLAQVPNSSEGVKYPSESSTNGSKKPFRMLNFNSTLLSKYNFIVLEKPVVGFNPGDFVIAEFTNNTNTKTVYTSWFKMLFLKEQIEFNELLVNTIIFPNLWSSIISYSLKVDYEKKESHFEPFIRQWIERPFETKWHLNINDSLLQINSHNVVPYIPLEITHDRSLKITLISPPGMKASAYLNIDWVLTLKMLFVRYRLAFISLPIFLVSMILSYQFFVYGETCTFISFDDALAYIMKRFWIHLIVGSCILPLVTNFKPIKKILFWLDPVGINNPFFLEHNNISAQYYYLGTEENLACLGPLFLVLTISIIMILYKLIAIIEYFSLKTSQFINVLTPNLYVTIKANTSLNCPFEIRHIAFLVLMSILVFFYLPYQFGFVLVGFIQIYICIKLSILNENKNEYTNLRNYNTSLLMLILLIMPINIPIIIVFLHNFAIRWETPFKSHHNCLAVLPIMLLIQSNSNFKVPSPHSLKIVIVGFSYMAVFSLIYGVRNLYWVHHIFNLICGCLFFFTLDFST